MNRPVPRRGASLLPARAILPAASMPVAAEGWIGRAIWQVTGDGECHSSWARLVGDPTTTRGDDSACGIHSYSVGAILTGAEVGQNAAAGADDALRI